MLLSMRVRYAVRRIRRAAPAQRILVVLLANGVEGDEPSPNTELVGGSLRAAVDRVLAIASRTHPVAAETEMKRPNVSTIRVF
jgi:hypothetical protein